MTTSGTATFIGWRREIDKEWLRQPELDLAHIEARDFADGFALAQRYPKVVLIHRAAEVDAGFDPVVLATMLGSLSRFRDDEIPPPISNPRRKIW